MMSKMIGTATLDFALFGCATEKAGDGRDDTFGGGKADTGGVSEGSIEAVGVLAAANTVSVDVRLTSPPDGVGVVERAVDNITYVRLGDDGVAGTEDDGRFTTLAELDAVPFVGPIAFGKLLAYARSHGLVPTVTLLGLETDRCDAAGVCGNALVRIDSASGESTPLARVISSPLDSFANNEWIVEANEQEVLFLMKHVGGNSLDFADLQAGTVQSLFPLAHTFVKLLPNPDDGMLYGLAQAQPGDSTDLVRVDPTTGEETVLGTLPGAGFYHGTAGFEHGQLRFFGSYNDQFQLITADITTGTFQPTPLGHEFLYLVRDPADGSMLGVTWNEGTPTAFANNIIRIDPSGGETLLGAITSQFYFVQPHAGFDPSTRRLLFRTAPQSAQTEQLQALDWDGTVTSMMSWRSGDYVDLHELTP